MKESKFVVLDVSAPRFVEASLKQVADVVSSSKEVLLVGEYHDDPVAHIVEGELLLKLLENNGYTSPKRTEGTDKNYYHRSSAASTPKLRLGFTGSENLWTALHNEDPQLVPGSGKPSQATKSNAETSTGPHGTAASVPWSKTHRNAREGQELPERPASAPPQSPRPHEERSCFDDVLRLHGVSAAAASVACSSPGSSPAMAQAAASATIADNLRPRLQSYWKSIPNFANMIWGSKPHPPEHASETPSITAHPSVSSDLDSLASSQHELPHAPPDLSSHHPADIPHSPSPASYDQPHAHDAQHPKLSDAPPLHPSAQSNLQPTSRNTTWTRVRAPSSHVWTAICPSQDGNTLPNPLPHPDVFVSSQDRSDRNSLKTPRTCYQGHHPHAPSHLPSHGYHPSPLSSGAPFGFHAGEPSSPTSARSHPPDMRPAPDDSSGLPSTDSSSLPHLPTPVSAASAPLPSTAPSTPRHTSTGSFAAQGILSAPSTGPTSSGHTTPQASIPHWSLGPDHQRPAGPSSPSSPASGGLDRGMGLSFMAAGTHSSFPGWPSPKPGAHITTISQDPDPHPSISQVALLSAHHFQQQLYGAMSLLWSIAADTASLQYQLWPHLEKQQPSHQQPTSNTGTQTHSHVDSTPGNWCRRVVLSLEMFERDTQHVLDDYTSGIIRLKDLLYDGRAWPNFASDYLPMVQIVASARAQIVAANAPRRYVSLAGREGLAAVQALQQAPPCYPHESPEAHQARPPCVCGLPAHPDALHPASNALRRKIQREMYQASVASAEGAQVCGSNSSTEAPNSAQLRERGGTSRSDSDDKLAECSEKECPYSGMRLSDNFFAAQAVWDATMADSILCALGGSQNTGLKGAGHEKGTGTGPQGNDPLVMHVCGKFHMEEGLGICEHLRRRRPHVSICSVVVLPVDLPVLREAVQERGGWHALTEGSAVLPGLPCSVGDLRKLGDYVVLSDENLPRTF